MQTPSKPLFLEVAEYFKTPDVPNEAGEVRYYLACLRDWVATLDPKSPKSYLEAENSTGGSRGYSLPEVVNSAFAYLDKESPDSDADNDLIVQRQRKEKITLWLVAIGRHLVAQADSKEYAAYEGFQDESTYCNTAASMLFNYLEGIYIFLLRIKHK